VVEVERHPETAIKVSGTAARMGPIPFSTRLAQILSTLRITEK